jgi:predicted transcriptional regulator
MGKTKKVTIRISPNQEQVLNEMATALDTSYSMLIRTIIGNWLSTNEEHIYRTIDRKILEQDAENQ